MTRYVIYYDSVLEREVAYPVAGFIDTEFTVSGSPQTQFTLPEDIDSSQIIDVSVNGRLQREGSGYTRDAVNNRINLSAAAPVTAWVKVRAYDSIVPGVADQEFTVSGSPQSQFNLSLIIDDSIKIDVWVDGRQQRENVNYTRDSANSRINFTASVDVGSWVKVRTLGR